MSDEIKCHLKILKWIRINDSNISSCKLNLYLQEWGLNSVHSIHGNKKASNNQIKTFWRPYNLWKKCNFKVKRYDCEQDETFSYLLCYTKLFIINEP